MRSGQGRRGQPEDLGGVLGVEPDQGNVLGEQPGQADDVDEVTAAEQPGPAGTAGLLVLLEPEHQVDVLGARGGQVQAELLDQLAAQLVGRLLAGQRVLDTAGATTADHADAAPGSISTVHTRTGTAASADGSVLIGLAEAPAGNGGGGLGGAGEGGHCWECLINGVTRSDRAGR
ncbi:hypothetical protein EDD38_5569 [Kitasatospora cineracea]|uniref:Uncharacterized protein n=1 Tax=Kitasatospora cineracea TaxID=88074 RepID=A0A3N4S1S7_9ACTN|nr:hypothetical protein [Kitasatospora cineracea]RPE37169.1 hypothetical protein EDD38_5569 [Kitasatospora cineracea]